VQIIVNGIITGLTIAVLALAFVVVYLPTRVFYVALGGIYALTPFIAWACLQRGLPWFMASMVAILVGVLLSLSCEQLNHAPLEHKQAASGVHLVSSLGIYIIIIQVIVIVWSNETKVLRMGLDSVTHVGTATITQSQVLAVIVSLTFFALFYTWLRFTQLGLQFRALADNPKEFSLKGYDVRQLRLIAFGISGCLGSVSSLLVAYDIGFSPQGGLTALLLAVVAMIIGGQRSFGGPVLGGVLLGMVRSQVVWFLSSRWQESVTFLLLALFLFVRPNGLLGQKGRLEAEE